MWFTNNLKAAAVLCLTLLMAIFVNAEELSGDLSGINRYPNSQLDIEESREAKNYPLISSRLKKVNSEVKANKTDWKDGRLDRRVYKIPTGHSSKDVYLYMAQELEKLGVQVVFSCDGRDCGASNLWANNTFDIAILNGYDRDQYYLLGSRQVESVDEYYVLYTIKRGNRRVYAMVDRLTVDRDTP